MLVVILQVKTIPVERIDPGNGEDLEVSGKSPQARAQAISRAFRYPLQQVAVDTGFQVERLGGCAERSQPVWNVVQVENLQVSYLHEC